MKVVEIDGVKANIFEASTPSIPPTAETQYVNPSKLYLWLCGNRFTRRLLDLDKPWKHTVTWCNMCHTALDIWHPDGMTIKEPCCVRCKEAGWCSGK